MEISTQLNQDEWLVVIRQPKLLVSETTWLAMRCLHHQKQVDFFEIAWKMSFLNALKHLKDTSEIPKNNNIYNFMLSRVSSKDEKKELDTLFNK